MAHAEPPEAALELAPHARGREAAVAARLHRVEDLRREDELVPTDTARAEPPPDRGLAAPAAVGVGGVEAPDPELPGGVHDRERLLLRLPLAEELGRGADPAEVAAAEDHARDLDAAAAERARLHRHPILGGEVRLRSRRGGT